MNRQDLINRLVARKMQSNNGRKGCVPCFARALCWVGAAKAAPQASRKN